MVREVRIGDVVLGDGSLGLIAGPCVAESLELCIEVGASMKEIAARLGMPYLFKASFDKANRTSVGSRRGLGLNAGLELLAKVRQRLGVPVLTDIHEPSQAAPAAEAVDVLQIPAFLARQTDLLLAAARTGKPVNVKKAQFMAPWDMAAVVKKLTSSGNDQILLTERGTCFGYNNLVVDFRSLPIMRRLGHPVVYDATHSLQLPGASGDASGAQREYAPHLLRAAVAVGCDALFMEVHPDPDRAWSDAAAQLPLASVSSLLEEIVGIRAARSEHDRARA
jgi:2-dehydro-3-deoxyphosphooctonate aldolase (KDO 8-P synthase)